MATSATACGVFLHILDFLFCLVSGLINLFIDATCVSLMTTSATACGVFLHILDFLFCLISGRINCFVCDATCVSLVTTSATACSFLHSANCAVFFSTSTTGSGSTARHGDTATC